MEILDSGAEARIEFIEEGKLKKHRLSKSYRIEQLDKSLRKQRNKREYKVLVTLYNQGINVPEPYDFVEEDNNYYFTFQHIGGNLLKEVLDKDLLFKAFNQIIKIHNQDIVHGDLTTLNMIDSGGKVFIIDFGLSNFTTKIEDKAVDLNLFFNCLKNEHPKFYDEKNNLLEKYKEELSNGDKIISRLEKMQQRGRNK